MKPQKRLLSLDALRGFDMFWITGGEEIIHLLAKATGWGWASVMAEQLTHPEWNGFSAYDLIFPLFLFMAGVSTPYSIGKSLEEGGSRSLLARKAIQRGFILVLLGIIFNNGLEIKPLAEMRFASVLGRIGLAGMLVQLLYIYFNAKQLYLWIAAILPGYWAFVMLIPVPECGSGLMTMECNPVSYFDKTFLVGRLHKVIHDPEGIISTIPAVATALLGVFAGTTLRSEKSEGQKVSQLVIASVGCLVVAIVWNFVFPINKNLWTSSFVLLTGGLSLLLLALFYWIIDVKQWNRWTFVFAVIGTNSILIYLAQRFIDFNHTSEALFGGITKYFSQPTVEVLLAIGYVLVEWVFLYVLYKKKLFFKV